MKKLLNAKLFMGMIACMLLMLNAHAESKPQGTIFDVKEFGAKGDGIANDTKAIQAAVDACAGSGGTVLLSNGKFLSGHVELGSDMTFHIDEDATLLGINGNDYKEAISHYPEKTPFYHTRTNLDCRHSILYADGAKNLTLSGKGTIDGQGGLDLWEPWPRNRKLKSYQRPLLMRFYRCKNLTVQDLRLRNSAMWVQLYDQCDGFLIENIHVDSNVNHSDGLNINDCSNGVVQNNYVYSDDDAIVLKSCCPVTPMENILIKGNTVHSVRCAAYEIGTDTHGPISNIRWVDNKGLKGYSNGGFIIYSRDGSVIDGLTIENHQNPFGVKMVVLNRNRGGVGVGCIKNIIFKNLSKDAPLLRCTITGHSEKGSIENVVFKDSYLSELPKIRREVFVHNVSIENCTVAGEKVESSVIQPKNSSQNTGGK